MYPQAGKRKRQDVVTILLRTRNSAAGISMPRNPANRAAHSRNLLPVGNRPNSPVGIHRESREFLH